MQQLKHSLKKRKLLTSIIGITLAITILFTPTIGKAIDEFQKQLDILTEVYYYIAAYHVSDVDKDELMAGAIQGMLDTLDDPYTTYFTDEEYQEFEGMLNSNFTGIGVYIEEKDGYIVVQAPIPGSPAEAAGLKAGDLIIKVEGQDIKNLPSEQVVNLIKGPEGTKVTITIKRGEQVSNVTISRQKIQLPSVEADMIDQEIGYLRLYQFGESSGQEVKQQLEQLKKQGMKKLILDLRGNPGGYLNASLDIAKNFIVEGPIVYVKDKSGVLQAVSISNGSNWDLPTVVLIDSGSASASEIVAGALKDYNKATIIGTNSFGKGTVQQLIPIEAGGYLKLTIEEYMTPKKQKVNQIGIKPDIEVNNVVAQLSKAILHLGGEVPFVASKGEEWIQVNGKDYIAVRSAVEALGGKVKWIDKVGVEISYNGQSSTVPLSDLLVKNQTSYMPLEALVKYIPVEVQKEQEVVIIKLK